MKQRIRVTRIIDSSESINIGAVYHNPECNALFVLINVFSGNAGSRLWENQVYRSASVDVQVPHLSSVTERVIDLKALDKVKAEYQADNRLVCLYDAATAKPNESIIYRGVLSAVSWFGSCCKRSSSEVKPVASAYDETPRIKKLS